jgi:guanylate kinase
VTVSDLKRGAGPRGAAPVVLAATSGTGKTTLAHRLVDDSDRYVFSVSATTRLPRPGERDGVDYHFLTQDEFERRVERGAFAEWARVHDRLYGTPRSELDAASARGEHVVLDIDVQGARQIRASVPGACLIFVLPPSVDIMMARLTGRGTEEPAAIARRLRSALVELQAVPEFDYVVVNDDLEECLEEIRGIVEMGVAPAAPAQDAEAFRNEITRILDEDYDPQVQQQERE